MKKIVLVDGNNLMFRSFFATMYSGTIMKNSKGFPTNALYGFVTMINKIIEEEKPNYMAVAFDIGKNFRHEKYTDYKAGRQETPKELKEQMPIAKDILDAMGIKHLEKEMYEADDIIGTIVQKCLEDEEFKGIIVSSDRDLLQLINFETDVKLLKQKGFIRYNEQSFKEEYGIDPIKIIDLKALSGDASDNIPGVKGVGDKTALSLLQKYDSLEGVYNSLDSIKGALHDKLINDKDNAFFSKELATIYREVPLEIDLNDLKYDGSKELKLKQIFEELEFFSFLKNINIKEEKEKLSIKEVSNIEELNIVNDYAFYIECDEVNYHNANILGMTVYDGKQIYYLEKNLIKDFFLKFNSLNKYTFDLKKSMYLLKKENIQIEYCYFDLMLALYLLNYYLKNDDLAYQINAKELTIPFYEVLLKSKFNDLIELKNETAIKARYIYNKKESMLTELKKENMLELFLNVEMPLVGVLCDMEYSGINVNEMILKEMQEGILAKIEMLKNDIYNLAGLEFNISSPKQLGEVLFDKLSLPAPKKNPRGFKTDINVLTKLLGTHPIIEKILEYRNLTKLNSTYLEGLYKYIDKDNKIHTIYKQTLTRTGRLSSVEPNLQNIPVKEEEGRKIRKAFIPSKDSVLISADYSQIELRLLAHISQDQTLINAFNKGEDIHKKVASDIYGVNIEDVTKEMRKSAKAVIFGIVYGISGFGLGENLNITPTEAKKFINKYYELYPKVKEYMDNIVKQAKEDGFVHTIYNRKRVIDELTNSNFMIRQSGERIALNTPIQGSSADIIKMAMIAIDKEMKLKNMKSKMLLQVHDELIFDALTSEQKELENIIKDKMENIVKLSVPLIVEIDSGINWYEAK